MSTTLTLELRCRLHSLLDFTCSCSSTTSPDDSAHSYPSFVSRFFIICSLWSCDVKILGAHCSPLHVDSCSSSASPESIVYSFIDLQGQNLVPSLWQIKPEQSAKSLCARDHHAGNLHAGNLQLSSTFISMTAIPTYIRTRW